MMLGQAFGSTVGLWILVELFSFIILMYGMNMLFSEAINKPSNAMMDQTATVLARIFVNGAFVGIQIIWSKGLIYLLIVLETAGLISFHTGEILKATSDTIILTGLTSTISLADMRELDEY
jgi:hypothetical protein